MKNNVDCDKELQFTIQTPMSNLHIISCSVGLHSLAPSSELSDHSFSPDICLQVKILEEKDAPKPVLDLEKWLKLYFKTPSDATYELIPPMCPLLNIQGFYKQVWQYLAQTVRCGETITYGELAQHLNNSGAVRAVGSAMRKNPLPLIIPCHRVVTATGLGLYHGGTLQKVKLWLLNHEGVHKFDSMHDSSSVDRFSKFSYRRKKH